MKTSISFNSRISAHVSGFSLIAVISVISVISVTGCGQAAPPPAVETAAPPASQPAAETMTMAASDTAAMDFELIDTLGKTHKLSDYKGKFVVLEWVNHGCPFVKKHYGAKNMQALQKRAVDSGAIWLSICSSAAGQEGTMTTEEWNKTIASTGTSATAVLLDGDGKVGMAYGARTTPHMFVVSPEGAIIYKGAIDDKPTADPADIPGAKNYVAAALDEAMAGQPVTMASSEPYGCSVKYAKP